MKIQYVFADETVEIDVTEEWASVLVELDRQEFNNNHAEKRRHCSLNALNADGNLIPADVDIFQDILEREDTLELHDAIQQLTPTQREIINALYFEGVTATAYSKQKGISHPAITHLKKRALQNLKNILSRGL